MASNKDDMLYYVFPFVIDEASSENQYEQYVLPMLTLLGILYAPDASATHDLL